MPPNRFESEVESFLEGSHGDRTHIKRADHPRLHHYAGRYYDGFNPTRARASKGDGGFRQPAHLARGFQLRDQQVSMCPLPQKLACNSPAHTSCFEI